MNELAKVLNNVIEKNSNTFYSHLLYGFIFIAIISIGLLIR